MKKKQKKQGGEEGGGEQNERGRRSNKRRWMGENWITLSQDRRGINKEDKKKKKIKKDYNHTKEQLKTPSSLY